uniref:Uncharacterized protein n=1 Tax=Aegilops tauschii TaxID=37682 RepID=N1R377_AEGTA
MKNFSATARQQRGREKYFNKLDSQMKLPHRSLQSLGLDHKEFLPVRAHATKIILKAAKFVVFLSSYIDNKLLRQCSGFLIEWDENSKDAVVLTSTHLICCEDSLNEWSGEHKYAPDAEVYIQLADDRIKAQLLYYHKHYGFALIRVTMGRPAELAHFGNEVNLAQLLYVLGRDENFNIQLSNGRVQYEGLTIYEYHHHIHIEAVVHELHAFIDSRLIVRILHFDIDHTNVVVHTWRASHRNGNVMGMASLSANMGFIPSPVLLKCLHLWRVHGCIPRIQLGMKFSPIIFQNLIYIEKISRECNTERGLIVEEVARGSVVEKLDMRNGDIILSVNGECVSTTVELELMLLRICEDNLVRGNGLGSNVDIPVDVFYRNRGRKCNPDRMRLTTIMSDDVEIIEEAYVDLTLE